MTERVALSPGGEEAALGPAEGEVEFGLSPEVEGEVSSAGKEEPAVKPEYEVVVEEGEEEGFPQVSQEP